MRDLFSEYYTPSDDTFATLWKEATFIFDTNVLLHLYRYTTQTRNDLLQILEQLQDRIWLPHQVGWEFSKNRLAVIEEQNDITRLVSDFDKFIEDKFTKTFVQKYGNRGHFFADLKKIQAIFQQAKEELQDELGRSRDQFPDPVYQDYLIERLDAIVRGKIGSPYSDAELAKLRPEFEERYKNQIPPGYMDAAKNKNQPDNTTSNPANKYGDVILWFQIIDYAKEHKKPIILVVDDVKQDWWQESHGKKHGPKVELRREMQEKAGVLFYMYTADTFLQRAQEFLQVQAQEATIQEIQENIKQETYIRMQQELSRDLALLRFRSNKLSSSYFTKALLQYLKDLKISRQDISVNELYDFMMQNLVVPLPSSIEAGEDKEAEMSAETHSDAVEDEASPSQDNAPDDTEGESEE